MVTLNDGSYFKDILKRLNNLDIYHIHYKALNTKDFGIHIDAVNLNFLTLFPDFNEKYNLIHNVLNISQIFVASGIFRHGPQARASSARAHERRHCVRRGLPTPSFGGEQWRADA